MGNKLQNAGNIFSRHFCIDERASMVRGRRVDLDPVASHFGLQAVALPIEDNQVRIQPGHMAINAVARYRMARFREYRRLRLVAAHAVL